MWKMVEKQQQKYDETKRWLEVQAEKDKYKKFIPEEIPSRQTAPTKYDTTQQ